MKSFCVGDAASARREESRSSGWVDGRMDQRARTEVAAASGTEGLTAMIMMEIGEKLPNIWLLSPEASVCHVSINFDCRQLSGRWHQASGSALRLGSSNFSNLSLIPFGIVLFMSPWFGFWICFQLLVPAANLLPKVCTSSKYFARLLSRFEGLIEWFQEERHSEEGGYAIRQGLCPGHCWHYCWVLLLGMPDHIDWPSDRRH